MEEKTINEAVEETSEKVSEEVSEEKKDERDLTISFLKIKKWDKDQEINILNFGSLDGAIHSVILIAAIVAIVKLIKRKKK